MISVGDDDRGVSIVLTYVLTLGVTTVLITGLVVGASGYLEAERDRSIASSLETTGERLGADLTAVERLATVDGTTETVVREVKYPTVVAGSGYRIGIERECDRVETAVTSSEYCLVLTATNADVSVLVPLGEMRVDIDTERSVRGGEIEIRYDERNGMGIQNV